MILYDAHSWRELLSWRGSVFPRTAKYAFSAGFLAACLKVLDGSSIASLPIEMNSSAFSGFTFTLGLVLVFRTNQSYSRFWESITSAILMRSKLFEASASLASFASCSQQPPENIDRFFHSIVRLVSLLHASALDLMCGTPDKRFPVIDLEGLETASLEYLYDLPCDLRVDVIYQWINGLAVESINSGLLAAPAPIVSRVFQELELSRTELHRVLQVTGIPIPFPYAQASSVLLIVYTIFTPIFMVRWTPHPAVTFAITFFLVLSLWSLELIAVEIENPFGDDVNDLQVGRFQEDFNKRLLLLLHPQTRHVPELTSQADMNRCSLFSMLHRSRTFSEVVEETGDAHCEQQEEQDNLSYSSGSETGHTKREFVSLDTAYLKDVASSLDTAFLKISAGQLGTEKNPRVQLHAFQVKGGETNGKDCNGLIHQSLYMKACECTSCGPLSITPPPVKFLTDKSIPDAEEGHLKPIPSTGTCPAPSGAGKKSNMQKNQLYVQT